MRIFYTVAIITFFIAVNILPQECEGNGLEISFFDYLEGKWIIEEDESTIHEEWTKVNDSLFTSRSFYVKDGDTTNTEFVRLERIGDDIFYIPLVEHNPGPVRFKLLTQADDKAVFENPEHDFPTKIIYHRMNNDSINASIEGMQNGELKTINYPFKRIK